MGVCPTCKVNYPLKGHIYCSRACSARRVEGLRRGNDVTLNCAVCEKQFVGKPGPLTGKHAWNRGSTAETDERIAKIAKQNSVVFKKQFASGVRSHKGKKNPAFGRTPDTRTPESRKRYSEAAIQRVLDGVSGYQTGHVTGRYVSQKCVGGEFNFKSSWELACAMSWDADPEIQTYEYEKLGLRLSASQNTVPDFLVTKVDGQQFVVEVKPTAIQELEHIQKKINETRCALKDMNLEYHLIGNVEIKTIIENLGDDFRDAVKCYKDRK